jgi:protease-4
MMLRLALLAAALATGGCFISVGDSFLMRRPRPLQEVTVEGTGKPKVLLVDISNVITDVPSRRAFGLVEEESTLARVKAELRKAEEDDRVAALVLRINSPGGGVTASDQIYTELSRFKTERAVPVVAALGDLATSGGYYVACAADRIVAHPTTVTGSIGVILMNLDVEGLLGKIGVRNQTYKAGRHKDMLSPFRGPTPAERRMVQSILDSMHNRFVAIVRENRPKLAEAELAQATDGRILDATQAAALGLVDQIGDLQDALEAAKTMAGVDEARVVTYERGGEMHETIYARAPRPPVQVNLFPVDLGVPLGGGPRFMYLWAPGLAE